MNESYCYKMEDRRAAQNMSLKRCTRARSRTFRYTVTVFFFLMRMCCLQNIASPQQSNPSSQWYPELQSACQTLVCNVKEIQNPRSPPRLRFLRLPIGLVMKVAFIFGNQRKDTPRCIIMQQQYFSKFKCLIIPQPAKQELKIRALWQQKAFMGLNNQKRMKLGKSSLLQTKCFLLQALVGCLRASIQSTSDHLFVPPFTVAQPGVRYREQHSIEFQIFFQSPSNFTMTKPGLVWIPLWLTQSDEYACAYMFGLSAVKYWELMSNTKEQLGDPQQ